MNLSGGAADAGMIGCIVVTATTGDVLIASAMRALGHASAISGGRGRQFWRLLRDGRFAGGVTFMALSFFSLLFSLSHEDVSLIAPAAGSLTFVSNAVAARWLLHENVDRRRWLAAVLVCCGVALLKR
jgi:drug/metabolite transporter (DMT)-like permease